jgi:hypothetical protein
MSDSTTTSAPAAPAAPPATDRGPAIGPAPASQPALNISDAARLLGQQRRAAQGKDGTAAEAPPSDRRPAPRDLAAPPPAPAAAPAPATKADTGLSAMERALGVPGSMPPAESTPVSPDASAAIEIEGRRYSPSELRDFISQAQDYTKKTQALAEREKQIEGLSQQQRALQAQQEALATVLPYIQPELARLQQLVQGAARPDPALLETDPQRYLRERAAFETAQDEQNRLGSINNLQAQAQQRYMETAVATANEQLAKEFPFWADPQQRMEAQTEIVNWATEKGGFSRDELRGLTSPHHLKAMMKAMQFDKWVAGAKTTAPAQRLAAPVRGTPPPPAPTERISVAEQAFDQRPSIRAGAALLAARRGNGTGTR